MNPTGEPAEQLTNEPEDAEVPVSPIAPGNLTLAPRVLSAMGARRQMAPAQLRTVHRMAVHQHPELYLG